MARVGFVGLGNMGLPMAQNLIKAGHQVEGVDVNPHSVENLKAAGGAPVDMPAVAAARADAVITMLPAGQHVRDVYLGANGIIAAANPGTLMIDCSTIDVATARDVAKAGEARGLLMLDAPVSGGVGGAAKGTLAVMVSGPKADVGAVKDALAVFGTVFVIGEKPGMAQTMKLANNVLSATTMAATAEAVAMGVKAGLDAAVMIDVINAGSGRSRASDQKFPQSILPRTFNYGFATGLMLKDVRLAVAEAKELGVPNEVISKVLDAWETTNTEYGGDSDFTSIVKMIERRAGVVVGKEQ